MEEKPTWMQRILKFAELTDALRIVPRTIIALYTAGLYWIVDWYIKYELQYVTKCDSATLNVLLRESVPIEEAKAIACTVSQVIGHPTGYTALVTTMVGAAAIVFGLYTKSGRSWEGSNSMHKSGPAGPAAPSAPIKPPSGFK